MSQPTRVVTLAASLVLLTALPGRRAAQDGIQQLPGLREQPGFKQYSGFLQAGGSRRLHYWFVESQHSPNTDPVVLWMNGGPGCSSLIGMMTELGPFRLSSDGHNLTTNPYSWNKVANVVFLEAPVGVGFSYDQSGSHYNRSDDTTADDNYLAVQDFFSKFPHLRKNDFYVTGESYAGVYVPMLTLRILRNPGEIRLKGLAIGNGFFDRDLRQNSRIFFGYYHGLFSQQTWNKLTKNCCNGSLSQHSCDFYGSVSPPCAEAVKEAEINFDGLNHYNLYDPCEDLTEANPETSSRMEMNWSRIFESRHRTPSVMSSSPVQSCIDDSAVERYLNRRDVKSALHVLESPLCWEKCRSKFNYTKQYSSMKDTVRKLVDSKRLRTLIYNGDVDMVCNFLSNQWFLDALGYPLTSPNKRWMYGKHVAGFFQTYKGNITFLTVKGAGHLVPTSKPAQALQMITTFLSGKPF